MEVIISRVSLAPSTPRFYSSRPPDFDIFEQEISDLAHWEQNKFEEVLSEHLKTEHDIKDEFYLEKEHIKAIKLRSVLDLICQERHPTAWNFIYKHILGYLVLQRKFISPISVIAIHAISIQDVHQFSATWWSYMNIEFITKTLRNNIQNQAISRVKILCRLTFGWPFIDL